jgi:hypothetical protein
MVSHARNESKTWGNGISLYDGMQQPPPLGSEYHLSTCGNFSSGLESQSGPKFEMDQFRVKYSFDCIASNGCYIFSIAALCKTGALPDLMCGYWAIVEQT